MDQFFVFKYLIKVFKLSQLISAMKASFTTELNTRTQIWFLIPYMEFKYHLSMIQSPKSFWLTLVTSSLTWLSLGPQKVSVQKKCFVQKNDPVKQGWCDSWNEDNLKNEDNFKNEDNLKNENDLKNEDDLLIGTIIRVLVQNLHAQSGIKHW